MAASTSTTGAKTPTAAPCTGDLAALLALHQEEIKQLMAARPVHFAFQLQMNEAIAASASLSPSFSNSEFATADGSPLNDDFAAAADEIGRLEQDPANRHQHVVDSDLQLHDRKVAADVFVSSEREWEAMSGNHRVRPYGGWDLGFRDWFGLYFKGLVVVDDRNESKLGAIGVAIFDSSNAVLVEVSEPLVLPEAEMRDDVAELEAFVHGLELALSLELSRVVFFSVDFNVDYILFGNQKPKEAKVAELVDRANLLVKRFTGCHFSHGTKNNSQLVLELSRSSIAKQTGKPIKETILMKDEGSICLVDADSGKMYETIEQHVNESSIPATEKVYCPNPKCSNLMSKTEALASIQSVATGISREELQLSVCWCAKCQSREELQLPVCWCAECHSLFCINCKVLWHSNMSCDDYKKKKKHNLDSSSIDAELKMLAHGHNNISCRSTEEPPFSDAIYVATRPTTTHNMKSMVSDTTTTETAGSPEQLHKTRVDLLGKGPYKLYFKGSVLAEGENGAKLGAIGFVIFNEVNLVVCKESKVLALPEAEMTEEVAQLEAFVHGLNFALTLGIKRLAYSCLDFNVHSYVRRKRKNKKLRFLRNLVVPARCYKPKTNKKPQDAVVAKLVDSISLLKRSIQSRHSSITSKRNADLVLELVRTSIAKQANKTAEEIVLSREKCPICLEDDVDSRNMFESGHCHHRFCSSCMKTHVEVKLRGKQLPLCPQHKCSTMLSFITCREFLSQEMHFTMKQLCREVNMPVQLRLYCPNPRCSYLMSKSEALATNKKNHLELNVCRCVVCQSLFCINCKVLWHSGMSCDAYKNSQKGLDSADAKLKVLAIHKKWRHCPSCSHLIERKSGCKFMHCRCGQGFRM